jgi:hypothetical protein
MEQTTLIAAKPKSRKLTPEEREQRNQAEKEKEQRILERKAQENNNNPKYCEDILNDVRAILDGNGKVNNRDDYKYIEGGVTKYLVADDPKRPPGYVKSSIDSRVKDLKVDKENLYNNHRTQDKAHPTHGSYEGHQHTLDNQKEALKRALGKLEKNCKDYPLTADQQKLKDRAEAALATPTPQEPDSKTRQNSATASESQTLKRAINSIPLLPQAQKDSLQKTLENAGIPKIIKDSINGGKEYWDKQGRQQVIDTLTTIAKLPVALVVIIVAAIATAMGFDSPLKVEADSTDKIASTAGNNTANTSQTPVTPSSTALTGTITGGISQTARTSTSTALTGIAAGSSPTALTGIAAGGENPQPTQLQQGLTLS